LDRPLYAARPKPTTDGRLKGSVLELAQFAFLDLAVNVIGVGREAGAEVLFNGERVGAAAMVKPPEESMR
jgi:hypothetical protein